MALEQETRPLELSHHEWGRVFGVKRAGGTDYRKALQHDPCAYCGKSEPLPEGGPICAMGHEPVPMEVTEVNARHG
jgi:hypothetical protein